MAPPLHYKRFCLGQWATNCYVVWVDSQRCWIVDAGFEPDPMVRYIQSHQLEPQQIILTHAHVDHIAGLDAIRSLWPRLPILIHAAEQDFLTEPMLNLSAALDVPVVAPAATASLDHGHRLELDGVSFEVRHTPGHSPGGITLYQADVSLALVGDALFAGGIGRTDFPTSDHATLIQSIQSQLYSLPDDTRVLTGHGPQTSIGRERTTNPFVRGA